MENASAAFLDAVRKSMRLIRSVIGAVTINQDLLTRAERLQFEGFQRREETNAAIMAIKKECVPIVQIAKRVGHSRILVRQVLRGGRTHPLLNPCLPDTGKLAGCASSDA